MGILCLLITALALLARNDKMFRFAQHDKENFACAIFVIASKAKQSTVHECLTRLVATLVTLARNDPPPYSLRKGGGTESPEKARAKLWRSHSTAAL